MYYYNLQTAITYSQNDILQQMLLSEYVTQGTYVVNYLSNHFTLLIENLFL